MSDPAVKPVPVLRGARVTLRTPAPSDADDARRIGAHPEIWRSFGEDVAEWRELTPDEVDAMIARLRPEPGTPAWVIDAGSGFIGTARLHSVDPAARSAAYAIGILAPDQLGHGLGTETTHLVLAYAFDDLGLGALTVRVLEFNARAIACYAGAGFVFDRREADAVTLDGTPYADVIMRLDVGRYRRLAPTWTADTEPPALY
jgi:RimJ/RimL family protein N-acetyltransferase